MNKPETIEEFYKAKFDWVPEDLKKGIGHFNIFRVEDFTGKNAKQVPFSRRDYYKVSIFFGPRKIQYADKTVQIQKQCLLFSNPQIPYSLQHPEGQQSGYLCVFTPSFFYHFGNLENYAVFQPGGTHAFELPDDQALFVKAVFNRMYEEMQGDYAHKYDALRNMVFELIHLGTKIQPAKAIRDKEANAARRISLMFLELLERQFPIEDAGQRFKLRSASDFANQLCIHVNHLNKALKETTEKTTSEIIADRVLQEAKILLRGTQWNVAEIANALGFTEVTHFNNFFKKKLNTSPTKFRND